MTVVPDPDLALDRDRAVLLADQLAHAGQAEAGAAVVLGHPAADELVEDGVDVARVDPATAVARPTSAGSPARARLKVMSTGESAGEYFSAFTTRLVTTRCIATPLAVARATSSATCTRAGSKWVERSCTALRATWDRSMSASTQRGVPGALAGELDQPLDHAEQAVGAGLDPVDEVGAGLVVGVADRVDEALDGGDRRPEVVVEGGVERVLGVLERLDVGAVAGHLGVAGEVAVVVVQRGDDHVAPEPGAVLAHPPAGVLDPAGRRAPSAAAPAAGRARRSSSV